MTDASAPKAAALLKKYGLHADRRLGQNFLEDPQALAQIVAAAGIGKSDSVLEIGAGLGSLTQLLSEAAGQVVAVELDPGLMPALKSVLRSRENVRLIRGDILRLAVQDLGLADDYVVAANIPYNITSAIIRHLLESEPRPRRMVLTVQQEVAERICAAAGEMSLLALSVQVYGQPSIIARIAAGAFFPPPRVDSAVLKIEVHPAPVIAHSLLPVFFKLTRAGFGQKRKTLRNSLSAGLRISTAECELLLTAAGINAQRRAETLDLPEWERLAARWSALKAE